MPWTAKDAPRHNKGLSSSQKKKWAGIATGILKDTGDEGKAIRVANAAMKRRLKKGS